MNAFSSLILFVFQGLQENSTSRECNVGTYFIFRDIRLKTPQKNFFSEPCNMQEAKKLFFHAKSSQRPEKTFFSDQKFSRGQKKHFFPTKSSPEVRKNFFFTPKVPRGRKKHFFPVKSSPRPEKNFFSTHPNPPRSPKNKIHLI